MVRTATKSDDRDSTNRRGHWQEEIAKANKRWDVFSLAGNLVVDRYRLERANTAEDVYKDRYNILYSSVETIRPSLYAKTPKVQATKRHTDRDNEKVTLATLLLEATAQYALEEIDFDEVINNAVEDYLLPGIGVAWVRYAPVISNRKGEDGATYETLDFEGVDVDYVHYRDFRTGVGRTWKELPWVARRVFFNRTQAKKRWGADKASKLQYSYKPTDEEGSARGIDRDGGGFGGAQAVIWEIWDKPNRKVVWYSEDFPVDVLEEVVDPLRLKDFFPCPRPLRAIHNTRTFIPKAFYSQYKAQAEQLDLLTERIRYLTEAVRVLGVYDGSQEQLQQLLAGKGNKLVAVQNWAAFAGQGGINGAIQWVPLKDVVTALTELLRQREIVKNEIYEISGFGDIMRGVSKASETLGAQEIKNEWASGRLRDMQKEVQRFCRDIIRIVTEIISEHFSDESLATYAGFEPPEVTPEEQAAAAQYTEQMVQYQQQQMAMITLPGQPQVQPPQKPPPTGRQQAIKMFLDVIELIRNEKQRCALIGIETDSTIMPDEAAERKDRMDFLGAAGAFLQQAGPMALQYPDMRGLLGALLMFVVRTFPASRAVEQEFETFTKKLQNQPAMPPPGQEGGGDNPQAAQATAQGAIQQEQIKAQVQQQQAAQEDATKRYEIDKKVETERMKLQQDHEYRMAQLALDERKVRVEEAKLGIEQAEVQHEQHMDEVRDNREERALGIEADQTDRQIDASERAARESGTEKDA